MTAGKWTELEYNNLLKINYSTNQLYYVTVQSSQKGGHGSQTHWGKPCTTIDQSLFIAVIMTSVVKLISENVLAVSMQHDDITHTCNYNIIKFLLGVQFHKSKFLGCQRKQIVHYGYARWFTNLQQSTCDGQENSLSCLHLSSGYYYTWLGHGSWTFMHKHIVILTLVCFENTYITMVM